MPHSTNHAVSSAGALPLADIGHLALKVGESVLVEAEGFGGGGYLRKVVSPIDEIVAVSEMTIAEDDDLPMPERSTGGSPPDVFRITALAPGVSTVVFRLAQPWMAGDPDDDAREDRITVTVSE